mgnify:CR=1 FL=1
MIQALSCAAEELFTGKGMEGPAVGEKVLNQALSCVVEG